MIKRLNLAELFPYYCFCMVIEFGILYMLFNSRVSIFSLFDIEYSFPLDLFTISFDAFGNSLFIEWGGSEIPEGGSCSV